MQMSARRRPRSWFRSPVRPCRSATIVDRSGGPSTRRSARHATIRRRSLEHVGVRMASLSAVHHEMSHCSSRPAVTRPVDPCSHCAKARSKSVARSRGSSGWIGGPGVRPLCAPSRFARAAQRVDGGLHAATSRLSARRRPVRFLVKILTARLGRRHPGVCRCRPICMTLPRVI